MTERRDVWFRARFGGDDGVVRERGRAPRGEVADQVVGAVIPVARDACGISSGDEVDGWTPEQQGQGVRQEARVGGDVAQQGDGEMAACRVAGEDDARRVGYGAAEVRVGGYGVLKGGRETAVWVAGEAIGEEEGVRGDVCSKEVSGEGGVSGSAFADCITAAMEV